MQSSVFYADQALSLLFTAARVAIFTQSAENLPQTSGTARIDVLKALPAIQHGRHASAFARWPPACQLGILHARHQLHEQPPARQTEQSVSTETRAKRALRAVGICCSREIAGQVHSAISPLTSAAVRDQVYQANIRLASHQIAAAAALPVASCRPRSSRSTTGAGCTHAANPNHRRRPSRAER